MYLHKNSICEILKKVNDVKIPIKKNNICKISNKKRLKISNIINICKIPNKKNNKYLNEKIYETLKQINLLQKKILKNKILKGILKK